MSRYVQWSRAEQSEQKRIAVTFSAGPVFLGLLPLMVAGLGPRLDRRLGLPTIRTDPLGRAVGGAMTVAGLALGVWSVYTEVDRGRGTPLPVMPTQELLEDGPFRYCRNPMTLGTIVAYLGTAIAARTTAGFALVVCLAAALLTYLKRVEERELAERFGEAYLAYKRATPFIVPRLSRRR